MIKCSYCESIDSLEREVSIEHNKIMLRCNVCLSINEDNNEILNSIAKNKFKRGDIVKIINELHVLNNEIGLIIESDNIFSTIELNNTVMKLPNHWMVKMENI